ncbi:MAG: class I SAM-dependent methyltransferase [Nitrospiraceae bacterium]
MSLFYTIAYWVGVKPWETAATREAERISAMFDREESGRQSPYGPALDLGCGTGMHSVELARRGWQVTGVEIVPKALRAARERVRQAGVEVQLVQGDVTALRAADVGSGFRFVLDFGCFHGLKGAQRTAMGREVTAVTAPDATMLMITWVPGRRGPLPRGASRADIEAAFPEWKVINVDALPVAALPGPLKNADPRCYRLRRD